MYFVTELNKKGTNLFNIDEPIAQKGDYKICFDGCIVNFKQLYALYYNNVFVKHFNALNEAKNYTKTL